MLDLLGGEFTCTEAENGAEGLKKAIEHNPDAVVADLEMPVMDGTGLLRALRADTRTQQIPVVIATTVTAVDRVNECRSLGCAGFVLKPVQKEYLMAKLRQVIKAREAR
jgi:CheY-like chemotaxis protein